MLSFSIFEQCALQNENVDIEEREDGYETEDGSCTVTAVRLLSTNFEIARFKMAHLDAEVFALVPFARSNPQADYSCWLQVQASHINSKKTGRSVRHQVQHTAPHRNSPAGICHLVIHHRPSDAVR